MSRKTTKREFSFIEGLKKMKISKLNEHFNAQEDTGVPIHRNSNFILIKKGSSKKFFKSLALMSRYTKKNYHRLCRQKRRKKNLVHKGLKRDHQNFSYERCDYESVDERSLKG